MGEKHENTNLSAEFYVLSMLYRKGLDASLTLGNKKSVDIRIWDKNKAATIDVKGIQKKSGSFPMENFKLKDKNHFIIFVSFADISNHEIAEDNPEIFIVPANQIKKDFTELKDYRVLPRRLLYHNPSGMRHVIDLNRLKKLSGRFKNRWDLLKK